MPQHDPWRHYAMWNKPVIHAHTYMSTVKIPLIGDIWNSKLLETESKT